VSSEWGQFVPDTLKTWYFRF